MKKMLLAAALGATSLLANPILYQTNIVYPGSTVYLTPETTRDAYLFSLQFYAQEEALGFILSTGNNPCFDNCYAHTVYTSQPRPSDAPEPTTVTFMIIGGVALIALRRRV